MADIKAAPMIVITPVDDTIDLGLKELWQYRHLFYWLTWRDVKVRYKQAHMGILWALLQPLALVGVLTFAIRLVVPVSSGTIPLPIFLLAGIAIWSMFTSIIQAMAQSLIANTALISKVYFPRLTVVLSSAGIPLMDFLVMYGLLFLACFPFGTKISPLFPLSLLFVLLALILSIGVGLWLATLNAKYADTRFLVPIILQVGMFASPVIYSMDSVPETWRLLVAINPMVGIIEGFRYCLFGQGVIDWRMTAISMIEAALLLVTGVRYFKRDERKLIDSL